MQHVWERKHRGFLWENLKERERSEDLGVDGMVQILFVKK